MSRPAHDPVATYFQSLLKVRARADGNKSSDIAKGDCTIMLQLIKMKLNNFSTRIDPSNPGRFRGIGTLSSDMSRVLGQTMGLHVPKWGASHFRGALRDDEARGNKRHLIKLVELLNAYKGTPNELQRVYELCIKRHHAFWESFSLVIQVQESDPFQVQLMSLLDLHSQGRVQQGLVYSALRRRHGDGRKITTKKTFAGDQQSSQSGVDQRGDVQIWEQEAIAVSIEIKDAIIDGTTWERIQSTHRKHDYALFVLGTQFRPSSLQTSISSLISTYGLHLFDFLLTLVFSIAVEERLAPRQVLTEIVNIYNEEFCQKIECDRSIQITVQVES